MAKLAAVLPKNHPLKSKKVEKVAPEFVEKPRRKPTVAPAPTDEIPKPASKLLDKAGLVALREAFGKGQLGLSKELGYDYNVWNLVESGRRKLTTDAAVIAYKILPVPEGYILPVDPKARRRQSRQAKLASRPTLPPPAAPEPAPTQDNIQLSPVKGLLLGHVKRIIRSDAISDEQAGKILHLFNQIALTVLTT